MKYFLVDISNNTERILKDFAFCILSRNAKKLALTANFTASWTLKTAKMCVSVLSAEYCNVPSVYFLLFLADAYKLYNLSVQNIDYDQVKKYAAATFPELAKWLYEAPARREGSFQIINMREIMKEPGIGKQTPILNAIANLYYKAAAFALINFDYKGLFDDSLFNCGFNNKFCLLVKIEKTQVKPQILMDLNDEYILLWVKDSSLRAEILKTDVTEVLPNTGIRLTYRVFELSKFRTSVLEFKIGGGGYKRLEHKRHRPLMRTLRRIEEAV
jgi:hypothetical protein